MIHGEFHVVGIPLSAPSKGARRVWVPKVAAAARQRWQGAAPLAGTEFSILVIYFHTGETTIDLDNLVKPILDAMKHIVHDDDVAISQIVARKTALSPGLGIRNASAVLAEGLDAGSDFIYVKIGGGPDHREIP